MDIIAELMKLVIALLDRLLPMLNVPDSFYVNIDNAFSFLIGLFQSASFFVPIDILICCLLVQIIVDNFSFVLKVVTYLIKLVRG